MLQEVHALQSTCLICGGAAQYLHNRTVSLEKVFSDATRRSFVALVDQVKYFLMEGLVTN